MNKEIRKERIEAEIDRAKEALTAAKNLFEDGAIADSISRAYYAIFHAARAVLLTKEIDTDTHSGAISMFGLHFVKTGLIEERFGRIFNEAKDARELGDYIVTKEFTKEETDKRVKQAIEFLQRVEGYLKAF